MSWSNPDAALLVTNALGQTSAVTYTSTSTIVVNGALRMYGVNRKALNSALDNQTLIFNNSLAPGCELTEGMPWRQDTVQSWIETARPDGQFRLSVRVNQPQGTCVPFTRGAQHSPYEVITGRSQVGGWWRASTEIRRDNFFLVYKDVHVLEMPDGAGYLMFLGRYRVLMKDAGSEAEAPNECTPGKSLSDIVVFHCPDADFADNVSGPHRLITSLNALSDEHQVSMGRSGQTAFRVWVGVPAGVFVGDTLYLYYACIPAVGHVNGAAYTARTDFGLRVRFKIEVTNSEGTVKESGVLTVTAVIKVWT